MTFEDPRKVLARHKLAPKKAFSQNFLVSRSAVEAIAHALLLAPGQRVIELGPGLGTLTHALLATGAEVVVVERDRDMIAVLEAELGSRIQIVPGDAATIELHELRGIHPTIALAGNLPYAITGAILRNLIIRADALSRAVIMVQKEVRDRLLAQPGDEDYGALTVFVQARFDVQGVLKVSAGSFHPPPKVDSAVVRLTPLATPRAEETPTFQSVVRSAFQARRKMLRKALELAFEKAHVARVLESVGIDGQRRGETLSVEEFRALAQAFAS